MRLEKRIQEWVTWFYHHKDTDMSVLKKIKFLTKTMDGCFELLIECAMRIRELEGKGKESSLIVVPQMKFGGKRRHG
jgi:hypothetical protein